MTTAPKTKTPTITVAGTSALIRANGNPDVKALLQDLPSREWRASKRAWEISARHSEALTELIAVTGAVVIDPDGKLSADYVAPANPAPYYFGTKNRPYFEDWSEGQVLRVRIESYEDAPGAMKGAGIVKVTPEGNAWLTIVSVEMETHEHLGRIRLFSTGKGRISTDAEVEAHLAAEAAEVLVEPAAPAETVAPVAEAEAPAPSAEAEAEEPAPSAEAAEADVPEAEGPAPSAEAAEADVPEAEGPAETTPPIYIFSDMNTSGFPSWEVGSLIQVSVPDSKPGTYSQVIDIEEVGSTWIRVESVRQKKAARFPRSQSPWYFETSCTARLATAAEIAAHLKLSPKN